jgi:CBS domain-containing protein
MTQQILYCYEDQTLEEVTKNLGDNQIRRIPVLSREKRLVGILALGDIATANESKSKVGSALGDISQKEGQQSSQQRSSQSSINR